MRASPVVTLLAFGPLLACAGSGASERAPAVAPAPPAARSADAEEPRPPGIGSIRPRPADPTCVTGAVRDVTVPPYLRSSVVRVRFVVTREGKVMRFDAYDAMPEAMARGVAQAVAGCEWIPGRDLAGKAVSMWVLLPLRFWDGDVGIVQLPPEQ